MSSSNNMSVGQNTISRTATPSTGTRTIVQPHPVLRLSAPSGVLRLRASRQKEDIFNGAEDVVDNEGMGKKVLQRFVTPVTVLE